MNSLLLVGVVRILLDHLHVSLHQVSHRLDEPQIGIHLAVLLTRITHNVVRFKGWQSASTTGAHHRLVITQAPMPQSWARYSEPCSFGDYNPRR